jgi:hypothetical protein
MRWFPPLLAGLLAASSLEAATLTENFASNPLADGWQIFGNTNLFQWDSTNQNLAVTWDSSQPNSYFYHPLGTILARSDDFSIAFDLNLQDAGPGPKPNKTGPFQLAIGLLNFGQATQTNYLRGAGKGSPNLVEFDYFFAGYYPDFPPLINATTMPVFISSSNRFAPTDYTPYEYELPMNLTVHIAMSYTASNQTLITLVTTNTMPLIVIPNVVLTNINNTQFSSSDDYRVDTIAVKSYSDTGAFGSSVLAHGSVGNLVIVVPPPPIQNLTGAFSNRVWQAQFLSQIHWLYTLERTADFQSWSSISPPTSGNATNLFLQDTNSPAARAYYRVRAFRP